MEQRWCLGNKKTNTIEKNLYPNQVAQRVFDQLKENISEKEWVVWLPGWPNWKPLCDVEELISEINILKKLSAEDAPPPMINSPLPPPPPLEAIREPEGEPLKSAPPSPPPPPGTATEPSRPLHVVPPQPVTPPPANRVVQSPTRQEAPDHNGQFTSKRKHKRIFARFRCIIRSTTLTFRTFTKDISLGGVGLEDEIPMEFIGSECQIYITSPKINKNIRFKIALTERAIPKYFSFEDADAGQIDELNLWLEGHEQKAAA